VLLSLLLLQGVFLSGKFSPKSFSALQNEFIQGYIALNLPDFVYDYRDYFNAIPEIKALDKEENFFRSQESIFNNFKKDALPVADQISLEHLNYEIDFNLERIDLEKQWVTDGRKMPSHGLHELNHYNKWYSFFIKKYTSLPITPEEVFTLGQSEVARVKKEIKRIQEELGFRDSITFYRFLSSDSFIIRDKQKIISGFGAIDQTVRKYLPGFIGNVDLPPVSPMEWPNAGANTPPGIYLNHEDNPYGKDVFQFNFYNSRYNSRTMEWLYMHEAIPGHHLQASLRNQYHSDDSLQQLYFYSGNAEGWACYVEYFGKEMGLYKTPIAELGKWEWDLVRSARLVIDAGIHYYGWSREEALAYWHKTIPGQDEIADREITRVTNWTAQALSYKVGADFIFNLKKQCSEKTGSAFDQKKFHRAFLSFGMTPLAVIEKNFYTVYSKQKS
jgi:uncharacterized protein (DUF885 family)